MAGLSGSLVLPSGSLTVYPIQGKSGMQNSIKDGSCISFFPESKWLKVQWATFSNDSATNCHIPRS